MYQTYCALCHGEDRNGYRADNAPSLRTRSLLSTAFPGILFNSIGWGRSNTAMDGYHQEMGGPLTDDDILQFTGWLLKIEDVEPLDLPHDVIEGDIAAGSAIYARHCATCHGDRGPGAGRHAALASLKLDIRLAVSVGRWIDFSLRNNKAS